MTANESPLVRIAEELADVSGVEATMEEEARTAPRRETVTTTKTDTRIVRSGGGVTTKPVETEYEETRIVGEKKVVDDRWLRVTCESAAAVDRVAEVVTEHGLDTAEAVTQTGEREYEIRSGEY